MKTKKLLLVLALLTLVGCSKQTTTSSVVSSSELAVVSSSEEEVVSSEEYLDPAYYDVPENYTEWAFNISRAGELIDIDIGKKVLVNVNVDFAFSLGSPFSSKNEASSSNEKVFKVEKINETNFTIVPLHAGRAYLSIRDEANNLRYRHIVYVGDPIAKEDMCDYLYEIDYWKSYQFSGEEFKMTFLPEYKVTISGTYNASKFTPFTTEYKFVKETEFEYQYTFVGDVAKSSPAGLTGFNISKCGDIMHLQCSSGTAGLMFPNTTEIQ